MRLVLLAALSLSVVACNDHPSSPGNHPPYVRPHYDENGNLVCPERMQRDKCELIAGVQ